MSAVLAIAGPVAVVTMAVAGALTHGLLRPVLEARGVTPWRARDTVAATPLVLLGSGGLGGAGALLGVSLAMRAGGLRVPEVSVVWLLVAGTAVALASALVLLLGLLAIRKLF